MSSRALNRSADRASVVHRKTLAYTAPPFGNAQWELFDLSTDPGETTDLSGTEAERLRAMVAAYEQYAQEVGVVPPDLDELLRSMGFEPPQR